MAGVAAGIQRYRVGNGVDLDVETARRVASDELPVRHRFRSPVGDRAVLDAELIGRRTEMVGGAGDEDATGVGTCLTHRRAALFDRSAAAGVALVRRLVGRCAADSYPCRLDSELVGGDRRERRPQ